MYNISADCKKLFKDESSNQSVLIKINEIQNFKMAYIVTASFLRYMRSCILQDGWDIDLFELTISFQAYD